MIEQLITTALLTGVLIGAVLTKLSQVIKHRRLVNEHKKSLMMKTFFNHYGKDAEDALRD